MRILLAIDDSESSQRAVQMVIQQIRPVNTEVRVLHVRRPPTLLVAREMVGYDATLETTWEMGVQAAERMVEDVAARLAAAGLKVSSSVEAGEPKSTILEVAEKWGADLIVIGSDPRNRLEGYWGGGIPEGVAHRAHCSVEIVRTRQKESIGMV
jgi:nucleotide-binding universal stress UspA family protein